MKSEHEKPVLTLSLTEDNVSCRIFCASSNTNVQQNSVNCFLNSILSAQTHYFIPRTPSTKEVNERMKQHMECHLLYMLSHPCLADLQLRGLQMINFVIC